MKNANVESRKPTAEGSSDRDGRGPGSDATGRSGFAHASAGEVRIRQTAIGLNYIDTYHRSGLYPVEFPSGLGLEAAASLRTWGRAWQASRPVTVSPTATALLGPMHRRDTSATQVVKFPATIDDQTAAGMMLKGITARYLLRATYKVKAGETILLHAAAGGVGLIAAQWAKALAPRSSEP